MPTSLPIVPLCELVNGQEADTFALLSAKEEAKTRDGRVYWRVTFRDATREVTFPIWNDSPHCEAARDDWRVGEFYKLRVVYRESSYGPQLEIHRIRCATPADRADGFDELMCVPRSRFDPLERFTQLLEIAQREIQDAALSRLVAAILIEHRATLLTLPAAVWHHHAFLGGFVEHVLSVTKNAMLLADRYLEEYPDLTPPLSRDLVIAGAILHDIGKLRELAVGPSGAQFTPSGELIGHIVLGRDILLAAAEREPIAAETLLRLEHLIIAHQRTAEWGSPKPPMTPEALLVHYADDIDAKLQMMFGVLAEPATGPFTSHRNPLHQKVFRGLDDSPA
jgi:3'-5' exoribonuclease